jgi:Zn-dependent membrane protease YugP
MEITLNTPALLFPAISLIMLAYTNRFLALAALVRNLHAKYVEDKKQPGLQNQIRNLRYRLRLIKNMQAFGIISFVTCIFCMLFIYLKIIIISEILFGLSLLFMMISLFISLLEIQLSNKALEVELSDMEDIKDPSISGYIKSKFKKD